MTHQKQTNHGADGESKDERAVDRVSTQWLGLKPVQLLMITIAAIFLAEVIAMIIISYLGTLEYAWLVLVDAFIMTAIVFPVLYYLSFQPLLIYLRGRERALAELRTLQLELEQRVAHRTADLNQAKQSLESEVIERRQAEEQLRYQATLLEHVSDAIIATDLDFIITSWNHAAETLYGWNAQEVIGKPTSEIFQTQYAFELPDQVREQFLQSGEWKGEATQMRKDGTKIDVLASVSYVRDLGGKPIGVISVNHDITERKRIEQAILLAKQEWERTFDAVPDLVAILDNQHHIMRLNRSMAERLGRTPQECIGLKCYESVHGTACAPDYCPHLLTCQDGQTHTADIYEPRLGGDFLVSTTPIFDREGKPVASVHVARDITEQKQAEKALRQARDELELRVRQRTQELAQANEVLARTNAELVAEIAERRRMEQTLMQTNELLERYFSSIDTLIAYMDRDFNFIRVNEAYAKSAGYPVDFFLGKNHFELYPHSENQAIFQRVVDTGEPYSVFEKPFEYPDQPERGVTYWDWSLQPVKGANGIVEGLVLSLVDVTGRKRAEDELARQNQELLARSKTEHELREFAESLAQTAISLNSSLELDQVLQRILEQIRRVIPFTAGDIIMKDDRTYRIAGVLNTRETSEEWPPTGMSYSLDDFPLLDQIFNTLQPLLLADLDGTAEWQRAAGLEWTRSYVGAPLVASGQVFGIVNLHSDWPGAFDQRTVKRLMAYTAPAAAAMQNAWLFEQVRSSRERLQALSRRLVEIQEGERRYIASELHDEVGQALTGLTLSLQLIEKKADDPQAVRAELAEMNRMLENVLEDLHRLAIDLRPASLDHLGLAAALRQHVAMVNQKFGLTAQFEMLGIQDRLPEEMEITFYRIVQEALNNVVRHARARHVDVIIEKRDENLILVIEDDGVGFDPEVILKKSGRLGLFGMQERVEMLGGKLIIESAQGKGTTLVVEVPYANAHSDR
jgi:PAS domain S-box-containing protein